MAGAGDRRRALLSDRSHALHRSFGAHPATTIEDVFAPRANAVGFLRLVFACLVVVDHSFPLAGHGIDPLWHLTKGQQSLGGVSVAGFFVLSGFLITRSASRTSLPRYLWHRVLRIFPGFLVCLVVTAFGFAALLWLHERGSLTGFLASRPAESPTAYIRHNALLTMQQYNIDGLLQSTPYQTSGYPQALDGSLWTLIYEFKCYLLIGLLAVGGVLRRARIVVPSLTVGVGLVVLLQALGETAVGPLVPQIGSDPNFARFTLSFLLGATAQLYSERIPMDDRLGILCCLVTVGTLRFGGFLTVGTVTFAYLCVWLGARLPFREVGRRRDLSYGIYIYGFPVQQTLADYGTQRHGIYVFITVSLVGTAVLALASWYLVERPALRLKDIRVSRPGRHTEPARMAGGEMLPVQAPVASGLTRAS